MDRRELLGRAGASAAALAFRPSIFGAHRARAAECGVRAGVQLFTVRDALQDDPRAAFRKLQDLGIVEAELFGLGGAPDARVFGLETAELQRVLADTGIRVPSSQVDGALADLARTAERASTLGISTLISSIPPEFMGARGGRIPAKDRPQLDALAERLNRAGRELHGHGLAFAYHNHDVEFVRVDGVLPYEY